MHKLGENALMDLYKFAFAHGKKSVSNLTEKEVLEKVRDWKQSRIGEIPNIKK